MSIIGEYRETELALKELESRLEQLKGSERLQRELQLVEKFGELVTESGFSLKEALRIVNPDAQKTQPTEAARKRGPRKEVTYKNPISGEVVVTKGGNHSVLKAWKNQYGVEKVNSWKVTE